MGQNMVYLLGCCREKMLHCISKIMFFLLKVSSVIHIRKDFAIWLSFNPHKPCKVLTRLYDFVWEFYNLTWEICVPRLRMIEKQFQTYTLSTFMYTSLWRCPARALRRFWFCLFVLEDLCLWSVDRVPRLPMVLFFYIRTGVLLLVVYIGRGRGVFVKQSPLPTYPPRQFLPPLLPHFINGFSTLPLFRNVLLCCPHP